ncbi:MAG: RNA polymerase sigma factor [Rectinemataceae bacterium]
MIKDRESDIERTYRQNRQGFLSWAAGATRSLSDAEDLVQEAFEKALADTEALDSVEDLAAWLFTSLRNRVRDLWRHRRMRKETGETEVSEELIAEIVEAAGLDPAELAEQAELTEALYEAIEDLSEEQRTVIEAQALDGLTFKELAESTGISPDTLGARKRYAIKRLADALSEWAGA